MLKNTLLFMAMGMVLMGCTSVQVSPIKQNASTQQTSPIQNICIVNNPKVAVQDFVPVLQARLRYHGIGSQLVEYHQVDGCTYHMEYVATRKWDIKPYLADATIELFHNKTRIAEANYHLKGGGGLALTKFASTETKMNPVIDQLLGR